ncbi:hypothetical protein SISSUDRAFT_1042273 [Sistotremastrum suecicum HHB10207 ss-3]|uniref:T6SS Phospholipase effector Tle1-like catalytic domain-containing protein n=1 Tax=Sistotremastrum suecicum HHB10207 ss-3 TaxID=1314776 RepID=A0A166GKX6_9AGAM|nr:hypothetical protein SISSUDRAFT_1042273 [Sistotremastrum suecicum HHB10207 ss-3]
MSSGYQRLSDVDSQSATKPVANPTPAPPPASPPADPANGSSGTQTTNSTGFPLNQSIGSGKDTVLVGNPIIPPTIPIDTTCWPPITVKRPRTLVLCFDGTGDQFDEDNSNIIKFFQCLKKNDPTRQMVYYQSGIGTYGDPNITGAIRRYIATKLDEAIAWYLHAHVQEGYKFLMEHYVKGDRICLIGFSRGAYTARALAGMVQRVGLLPQSNTQQVPFAWKFYKDQSPKGDSRASEFKAAFSNNVRIDFVGVFDTVASVGIIPRELPFTDGNRAIRVFRHALSLDERRVRFQPNHFHNPPRKTLPDDRKIKKHQLTGTLSQSDAVEGKSVNINAKNTTWNETDHMEVWFAGSHSDVGGGNVKNEVTINLAMVPLRWLIHETIVTQTGILFDLAQLSLIGLSPQNLPVVPHKDDPPIFNLPLPPVINPTPIPKDELKDAVEQRFDQLKLKPIWWLLEILPMKNRVLNEDGRFVIEKPYWRWNLGKGRRIPILKNPLYPVLVHRAVKYRYENFEYVDAYKEDSEKRKKGKYLPNAYWVDSKGTEHALRFDKENLPPSFQWVGLDEHSGET